MTCSLRLHKFFPHQLVFEESGKIYMKAVGDEEVVSVESLTALTDLESLADGRKRLKGYSQEDLLQEAAAFLANVISDRKPHSHVIY